MRSDKAGNVRTRLHQAWLAATAVGLVLYVGGCAMHLVRPCTGCKVEPSRERCLSLRQKAAAWGEYVHCVECVAATKGYDPSSPPMYEALSRCNASYFEKWDQRCGNRFVTHSNGRTILDRLSGLEWEKKGGTSRRLSNFGPNGCFCTVDSEGGQGAECSDPNFFGNCYSLGEQADELATGTLQRNFIPGINNMNSEAGYAGFRDWRLPNFIELLSTMEPEATAPKGFSGAVPEFKALDPSIDIPATSNNGPCPYYWAGTLIPYQTPSGQGSTSWNGWYVQYDCNPTVGLNGRENLYRARAVRRGL